MVRKYVKEVHLHTIGRNNIKCEIATFAGVLRCFIHPFDKKCQYWSVSGKPILFEPMFEGEGIQIRKAMDNFRDSFVGVDGFWKMQEVEGELESSLECRVESVE